MNSTFKPPVIEEDPITKIQYYSTYDIPPNKVITEEEFMPHIPYIYFGPKKKLDNGSTKVNISWAKSNASPPLIYLSNGNVPLIAPFGGAKYEVKEKDGKEAKKPEQDSYSICITIPDNSKLKAMFEALDERFAQIRFGRKETDMVEGLKGVKDIDFVRNNTQSCLLSSKKNPDYPKFIRCKLRLEPTQKPIVHWFDGMNANGKPRFKLVPPEQVTLDIFPKRMGISMTMAITCLTFTQSTQYLFESRVIAIYPPAIVIDNPFPTLESEVSSESNTNIIEPTKRNIGEIENTTKDAEIKPEYNSEGEQKTKRNKTSHPDDGGITDNDILGAKPTSN